MQQSIPEICSIKIRLEIGSSSGSTYRRSASTKSPVAQDYFPVWFSVAGRALRSYYSQMEQSSTRLAQPPSSRSADPIHASSASSPVCADRLRSLRSGRHSREGPLLSSFWYPRVTSGGLWASCRDYTIGIIFEARSPVPEPQREWLA